MSTSDVKKMLLDMGFAINSASSRKRTSIGGTLQNREIPLITVDDADEEDVRVDEEEQPGAAQEGDDNAEEVIEDDGADTVHFRSALSILDPGAVDHVELAEQPQLRRSSRIRIPRLNAACGERILYGRDAQGSK